MTRMIPYILYLLLIGLYRVILGDAISIYGVSMNLPVLLVLLVGLHKTEVDSCWFGFVVGLVAYAGITGLLGWHGLIMAAIGFLAFHSRSRINLESRYSRLLLICAGLAVHNIIIQVKSGGDGFLLLLVPKGLTGALYTTAAAWIFFTLKEGQITFQKIKAIF